MTIFLFLVGNLEAFLEKVFQPFFTNKPIRLEIGLGLSLNKDIFKDQNGKFQFDFVDGEGIIFTTILLLSSPNPS
tara:strand:- start:78 stop:302 length:225 start_codon:yes stop_codon:yes gene_type:complete